MKKKLLSILLVLNLMLALVPAAFAADIVDSGTCGAEGDGSSVTWTIDKNGVLTVTGTGAITSDAMQIRQLSNRSDVTSAVIGEGITDMGALWLDYIADQRVVPGHDHPAEKRVQRLPGADERASAGQAGVACRRLHGVQKPDDDRAAGHTEVHFGQLCQLRGPDRGRDPRGCDGAWRRRV